LGNENKQNLLFVVRITVEPVSANIHAVVVDIVVAAAPGCRNLFVHEEEEDDAVVVVTVAKGAVLVAVVDPRGL
jgi:hypothetical protein